MGGRAFRVHINVKKSSSILHQKTDFTKRKHKMPDLAALPLQRSQQLVHLVQCLLELRRVITGVRSKSQRRNPAGIERRRRDLIRQLLQSDFTGRALGAFSPRVPLRTGVALRTGINGRNVKSDVQRSPRISSPRYGCHCGLSLRLATTFMNRSG